ncbi:dihydrolipoamide acetyltransferase family protein [Leifsonia aquatica]|uniref:dihydrolipoamide acetyltransferase family protein n=1 Tax=Leifsonia aquatica TaxID=144185 RepID=UPI0004689E80|nr:dihydrolipoamide acetyltransferase family protein [Leifsonia aquatica]
MIDILMPRLSDTMTEGAIAAWHKKPGDPVAPGDLLVEIETDKALMEQEAYDAGVLAEILVPAGENVAIGTPIARLDDGGGDGGDGEGEVRDGTRVAPPETVVPEPATGDPASAEPPVPTPAAASASVSASADRRTASPLVRRVARERGLDLAVIIGTGPGGRIVRADLDGARPEVADAPASTVAVPPEATPPTGAAEGDLFPFDGIRRAIATRLTESATTVPTFTATVRADVGDLLALRAQLNRALENDSADGRPAISLNDLLVRAVALALREHPGVNASYSAEGGGATLRHRRVNVGIAVAAPGGLVVPVVPDADRASVSTIAALTRDLIAKAADRTLTSAEMAGGTFSLSNLGMYGVDHFTAIVNPPQGAILAVGAARDELALIEGEVEARTLLSLTITADHRIIDGALAAQFLRTLRALLEHPLRILA